MPMQIIEDEKAITEHTVAEDASIITKQDGGAVAEFTRVYVDYRQSGRRVDCRVHPYVRQLLLYLDDQRNR